ncbi:putative Glyoxalase/fosfomycin resistance/dioxygenase domain-containing protein [Seiridium cardinale]
MARQTPAKPTSFSGINHLKLPCDDIIKTSEFYERVFPFKRIHKYNHYTPDHKLFAIMLQHEPTNLIVELRYVPLQAKAQKGWDPITWVVGTRKNLEEWAAWLDGHSVQRNMGLTGIKGWVMACEHPDGRIVRLYVEDEEHEWTDHPDKDEYWLETVEPNPTQED